MDKTMIANKVKALIAHQMGVSESSINLDTRMKEDLRADSANVMMLVMDLEQEFNITVDDDALLTIKTVGDIVTCLETMV